MFFSFEGIDGSGKSTQARLLSEALRARGHAVLDVREPGGTSLGERIRGLLLDPGPHVGPRAEVLLFSAARAQLVAAVIQPALDEGTVVVADRFYDSTTAYQGYGRGIASEGWMEQMNRFAAHEIAPDRTYFVDVPIATAASRRADRPNDRMEAMPDEFYERVRAGYHALAVHSRVLTLDGTRPVGALHEAILDDALSALSRRG